MGVVCFVVVWIISCVVLGLLILFVGLAVGLLIVGGFCFVVVVWLFELICFCNVYGLVYVREWLVVVWFGFGNCCLFALRRLFGYGLVYICYD